MQGNTIGIVGGGQLGRMLTLAAKPLGYNVIVIDPNPYCSSAQVGAEQIEASFYDKAAIEELGTRADFLTIESEHINTDVLEELGKQGKPVNPTPATVRLIQDKLSQKRLLSNHNIATTKFEKIDNSVKAKKLLARFGGKMVVKTRRGGYDGNGNAVVTSNKELIAALDQFKDRELYAEELVPFDKELAVMIARGTAGETTAYPVVETRHERNICVEVLAPAPVDSAIRAKANSLALKVADHLKGAGVFGIEMFLMPDGEVLVNEIAPRVHNSGHYTIEACRISQFEQHIRAIAGLPLGSTDLTVPAAVMVNILGERSGPTTLAGLDNALATPHTNVHLYGKSPTKIDRKMGHITSTGKDIQEAGKRARSARRKLKI